MDEKLPWYGRISNRQILVDSVRALAIWLAVSVPLFALLWWLSHFSVLASIRPMVGAIAALGGFIGLRIVKWRRRA